MCNTLRSFGAQNRRAFRAAAVAAGLEAARRDHLDRVHPERIERRKEAEQITSFGVAMTSSMSSHAAAVAEAFRS